MTTASPAESGPGTSRWRPAHAMGTPSAASRTAPHGPAESCVSCARISEIRRRAAGDRCVVSVAASAAAIAAERAGHDIGEPEVLARYERMRRADVGSRTLAIDLVNRTLLTDFLPVQGARGLALYALDQIGPLPPPPVATVVGSTRRFSNLNVV